MATHQCYTKCYQGPTVLTNGTGAAKDYQKIIQNL